MLDGWKELENCSHAGAIIRRPIRPVTVSVIVMVCVCLCVCVRVCASPLSLCRSCPVVSCRRSRGLSGCCCCSSPSFHPDA